MCLLNLIQEIGLRPKLVASTNGGEYHSACPKCGGTDRFFIQPNRKMKNCSGSYCCRQCGISGDSIQFCRDFLGLSFKEAVNRVDAIVPERINSFYQLKKTSRHKHAKLKPLSKIWISKANAFVEKTHKQILQQLSILEYLERRGISLEAVKKYKIGWNSIDLWNDRSDWGIREELGKRICLPKGIVIPSIDLNDNIIRLKIRRYDWKERDEFPKYIAISGGMNGLNIIGNTKNAAMIVVESKLDAYAIHYAVGDFVFVVAVGSNIKNPDNITNYLAKHKTMLLICYDNDDAGKLMFDKWKRLYSHAQGAPTPVGKDIGEAIKHGFNTRTWFVDIDIQKDFGAWKIRP